MKLLDNPRKLVLITGGLILLLFSGFYTINDNSNCESDASAKAYIENFDALLTNAKERKVIDEMELHLIFQMERSGKAKSFTESGNDWRGLCNWLQDIANDYGI